MIKKISTAISLLTLSMAFAESPSVTTTSPSAALPKTRKWKISTFLEYPDYSFLLSTGEGRSSLQFPNKRLLFSPSNAPEAGVRLSREMYSIQYRTYLRGLENIIYGGYDTGKTTLTDLRFEAQVGFLELGLFYQKFSGFFVDLSSRSGFTVGEAPAPEAPSYQDRSGPEILLRPDISALNLGFKPKLVLPLYDPRAKNSIIPLLEDDKEKFLGIHFTFSTGFHHLNVSANSPFVPGDRQEFFAQDSDVKGVAQNALSVGMGAQFHLYPGDHWDLSMGGGGNGEIIYQKLAHSSAQTSNSLTTGKSMFFDLSTAYERGRHLLQISYDLELRMSKLASAHLDSKRSILGMKYALAF